MTGEETVDFQEHSFICPYCSQETIVEAPVGTTMRTYGTCDECGREFLIENDVPRQLPTSAQL
jgi:transcription elongation factor Elf1